MQRVREYLVHPEIQVVAQAAQSGVPLLGLAPYSAVALELGIVVFL